MSQDFEPVKKQSTESNHQKTQIDKCFKCCLITLQITFSINGLENLNSPPHTRGSSRNIKEQWRKTNPFPPHTIVELSITQCLSRSNHASSPKKSMWGHYKTILKFWEGVLRAILPSYVLSLLVDSCWVSSACMEPLENSTCLEMAGSAWLNNDNMDEMGQNH